MVGCQVKQILILIIVKSSPSTDIFRTVPPNMGLSCPTRIITFSFAAADPPLPPWLFDFLLLLGSADMASHAGHTGSSPVGAANVISMG